MKTDKFFNHFGRSDAWNSTHHGRYVFQTRFFREKYLYIYIQIHIHVHLHVHIQIQIHVHLHVRVRVCLCFFVVWCRWWWSGVWCGVNGAKVAEQIV